MSEPWPDALFGVDGTELSPPVPGRSGGDRSDAEAFPSLPLPPIPKFNMTREEIAAALGEDLRGPADRAPAASPSTASVPAPRARQPSAPQPSAPQPSAPQPSAPQPKTPQVDTTAMRPGAAGSPTAGSTSTTRLNRPVISAAPLPTQGTPRGLGVLRYGRRAAPRSRPRVQRRDVRRRVSGPNRGLLTHTRSNGGAGAFFVITLITFAVLLYFIISGIVAAFARLIP